MYVIEYQHRGLPHAHIVIKLYDVPEETDGKIIFIDEHIRARYPTQGQDTHYAQLITEHMVHRCSDASNGCLDSNNLCKRGYPKPTGTSTTTFDDREYPIYCYSIV